MTATRELAASTFANPFVTGGLNSLDVLSTHASSSDTGRDFVFAHVLIPHPPHQLTADCTVRVSKDRSGSYVQLGVAEAFPSLVASEYEQQRACLNGRLQDLLAALPNDASVVLTGDHGTDLRGQLDKAPANWSESDIQERFSIFHAARLPKGCRLTSARDLVNLIRSEIACVTGASLPDVEPYFEISPYYLFPDIPERVLTVAEVIVDRRTLVSRTAGG